ncbi:MAG: hypothetical protein AAF708_22555, partial [Deinococcota bacterium]
MAHFLVVLAPLAQESGLTLVDFPYEITDDFDVSQVTTISYIDQLLTVNTANPNISVYAYGTDIVRGSVFLHDAEGNVLASDIIDPVLRFSIVFSHENTVRADVVDHFYFGHVQDDLWVEIYQDIENHPNFTQALALRRTLPPFG